MSTLDAARRAAEEALAAYDRCKGYEAYTYAFDCVRPLRDLLAALPAEPALANCDCRWDGLHRWNCPRVSASVPVWDRAAAAAPPDAVREAAEEVAPQLEGFCVQAETDARPPGGQQAGLDKSWASRVPTSVLKELRWYAREFRRFLTALDAKGGAS